MEGPGESGPNGPDRPPRRVPGLRGTAPPDARAPGLLATGPAEAPPYPSERRPAHSGPPRSCGASASGGPTRSVEPGESATARVLRAHASRAPDSVPALPARSTRAVRPDSIGTPAPATRVPPARCKGCEPMGCPSRRRDGDRCGRPGRRPLRLHTNAALTGQAGRSRARFQSPSQTAKEEEP